VPALTADGLAALSIAQADAFGDDRVLAMTVAQTMAFNMASRHYATPLVLDLDDNGVSTLGIAAGVRFDIRGDGQAVRTGWVAPTDGLLALDRNGDGVINDGGELFGGATSLGNGGKAADGYAALADLDDNDDGRIDRDDAAYGALRVWVDGNSDGVSQADELKTLEQLKIASISTGAKSTLTHQNGNAIGLTSSYTSTDGSVHDSADVWFLAQQRAGAASGAPTLQQQVSGLSGAIAGFSAAAGAPSATQAQQLTAAPAAVGTPGGGDAGVQALTDALKQYRLAHGPHSAAGFAATQRDAVPGAGQAGDWFSVPNR